MPSGAEHGGMELDERTKAVIRETAREVVAEHTRSCPIIQEFHALSADMYGPPGQKEEHPGVMGRVASLESSRTWARAGLYGLWAVAMTALGEFLRRLLGK